MYKVTIIDLDNNNVELEVETSCIMGAFIDNEKTDEKRACIAVLSMFNDDIENAYVCADALEGVSRKEKNRCAEIVKKLCAGEESEDVAL